MNVALLVFCLRRLVPFFTPADADCARAQRGLPITQHDRLGDKAINSHNATQRHNEGLAAIYTAIRCASTTANAVRMGDKGDGTPASKAGG